MRCGDRSPVQTNLAASQDTSRLDRTLRTDDVQSGMIATSTRGPRRENARSVNRLCRLRRAEHPCSGHPHGVRRRQYGLRFTPQWHRTSIIPSNRPLVGTPGGARPDAQCPRSTRLDHSSTARAADPTPTISAKTTRQVAALPTTAPAATIELSSSKLGYEARPGCDPAYPDQRTCIPPGPPFNQGCKITDQRRFTVLPPDPQHLDSDGDGVGCEPVKSK